MRYSHKHCLLLIIASVLLAGGCEQSARVSKKSREQILLDEKQQLAEQVESLRQENVELKKQMEVLVGLDSPVRAEALTCPSKITLSSRTNIYDKDKDETPETLVVYVVIQDDTGDRIKTPGAIEVQLWDLNRAAEDALLKTWKVPAVEVKKAWVSTMMTSYYRLKFNISDILTGTEEELTVKAIFTDYLTGKVLKAQRVIKP